MKRHCRVAAALLLSACAPPGYVYEPGDFFHPHPSAELCASRNLQLDLDTKECVVPPPALPPLRQMRSPAPGATARPAVASKTAGAIVPIEATAVVSSDLRTNTKLLKELMSFVIENGFQCQSISAAEADAQSHLFKLACNHSRYAYEIESQGGHWIVTPK